MVLAGRDGNSPRGWGRGGLAKKEPVFAPQFLRALPVLGKERDATDSQACAQLGNIHYGRGEFLHPVWVRGKGTEKRGGSSRTEIKGKERKPTSE